MPSDAAGIVALLPRTVPDLNPTFAWRFGRVQFRRVLTGGVDLKWHADNSFMGVQAHRTAPHYRIRKSGVVTVAETIMRLLSFALVLTGTFAGCAALESRSSPEDEKITTAVENSIHQRPDLGPPNLLYVKTTGHVVYLSGIADTGLQSRTAESLALETAGVTRVVNNISVSH